MLRRVLSYGARRAAQATRRWLPGTSANWGPVRGEWVPHERLARLPGLTLRELYPSGRIAFTPLDLPADELEEIARFSAEDDWSNEIRGSYLAALPGGRYFGAPPTVITPRDELLTDWYFPHGERGFPARHPALEALQLPAVRKLDGTALVLMGHGNLYHFLYEAVPRLLALKDLGLNPAACDWFIARAPELPAQRELYEWLGVPPERLVPAEGMHHYEADTLVFGATTYGIPPVLCERLRRELAPFAPPAERPGKRRLYLMRGPHVTVRRIVNEPAVCALLEQRGFETIDLAALSLREQARCFAEAEVIVSPHGAALANLLWCAPGTRVIEIRCRAHRLGYWKLYWNLGSSLGLRYHWLSIPPSSSAVVDPQYADLEIPLAAIERQLERVL